jgi:hypothetical protein
MKYIVLKASVEYPAAGGGRRRARAGEVIDDVRRGVSMKSLVDRGFIEQVKEVKADD